MGWETLVGAGLGLIGASKSADATKDAASQNAALTQEQIALEREMFEKSIALQEPWRQSGYNALNQLNQYLGLDPLAPYVPSSQITGGADSPTFEVNLDGLDIQNGQVSLKKPVDPGTWEQFLASNTGGTRTVIENGEPVLVSDTPYKAQYDAAVAQYEKDLERYNAATGQGEDPTIGTVQEQGAGNELAAQSTGGRFPSYREFQRSQSRRGLDASPEEYERRRAAFTQSQPSTGQNALTEFVSPIQFNDVPEFEQVEFVRPPAFEQTEFVQPEDVIGRPSYDPANSLNSLNADQMLQQFQASPGYNFRMQEGVDALDRSAAARGGLFSGRQGKALTDFAGNLASAEYGNWYNRRANEDARDYGRAWDYDARNYGRANDTYNRNYGAATDTWNRNYGMATDDYNRNYLAATDTFNRNYGMSVDDYNRRYGAYGDQLNRLSALAGVGQTATNNMTNAGQNFTTGMSNAYANLGRSNAATGAANAQMWDDFGGIGTAALRNYQIDSIWNQQSPDYSFSPWSTGNVTSSNYQSPYQFNAFDTGDLDAGNYLYNGNPYQGIS